LLFAPLRKTEIFGPSCGFSREYLDFLLSAKRDAHAAECFFRKMLKALHNQTPQVINVEKNAAYPQAMKLLKLKKFYPKSVNYGNARLLII